MKKTILYLGIVAYLAIAATSCNEKLDNWYSATRSYDGRFVVAATCQEHPSKNAIIEKGNEIYLYNTAANVANEIWLEDVTSKFPLKSKFKLNGTPDGFSGAETADNIKSNSFIYNSTSGEYILFDKSNKADFPVATAVGQIATGYQEYIRATLVEGKILPKAATTPGGNVSDSVYIKLTLITDNVKFISSLVPESDWAKPGVPEYAWTQQAGSNSVDASKDEHWTLAGYRYTGYPEDM